MAKTKLVNTDYQALAKIKAVRTSPRKLNIVAGLIRRKRVAEALVQLEFSKRRVSNEVKDCLASAIANAENNHDLNVDNLYVSSVLVGKAFVMKRMRPRARGRSSKINKPFSSLTIIVEERED